MVSQVTRLAVWDTLCDLEADMRYCFALSDRRKRFHRLVRFGLLMGITFEGALLYGATQMAWFFLVGVFVGLLLAWLTIWDAMSNYAADAATLKIVASTCGSLKRDTEVLWRKIENGLAGEDMVEENLKVLQNQWSSAMQWIQSEADLTLKRKTEEQANGDIVNRYVERL